MGDSIKRKLTAGEIQLLRTVFGTKIPYDKVFVFNQRWSFVFPDDRAMAPNGNVYLPGEWYRADLSTGDVPLRIKANFVHEATHLYQTYGLNWSVWLRGPFDRNYDYQLVPDQKFEKYGLEQMGMIAQHYFTLRSGGVVPGRKLADYASLLPVR